MKCLMPCLLLSPSEPLFGLLTQHPLFPIWERACCMTRPNNGCLRDNAYCHSSKREKIKIIPLQLVTSKKKLHVILLQKANWNSVVPQIDPNQKYIAISNKRRYIEQEKRIIFERGLLDRLLPIWTLPSACVKYMIKCRLFYKELTCNWVKSRSIENSIIPIAFSSMWIFFQWDCTMRLEYVIKCRLFTRKWQVIEQRLI